MNERIKKLAEQATEEVMRNTPSFLVTNEMWKEKFALLIARECMHLCVLEQADPRDTVEMSCALRIKKHFGVDYE